MKRKRKNGWFQKLIEAGAKTTYRGKIIRTTAAEKARRDRSAAGTKPRHAKRAKPATAAKDEDLQLLNEIAKGQGAKSYKSLSPEQKELVRSLAARIRKNPSKFAGCVAAVTAKGSARSPRAVCAKAGRKKYGRAEMTRRAKAARAAKRKKRNPDQAELEAAARLSEQFHGRPARRVRDVEELDRSRDTLADLGRMISFTVWVDEDRPYELGFEGVRLASSPDGGQLYLVGNQRLDLKALGLNRYVPKDHITVGPVETVVYHTSKAFHNFEPTDYEHTFAEEGGEMPILGYDVLSEKFYLTGGSYHVKPEGIVN